MFAKKLHSCETHREDRPSHSESILWPQYKPQEHSGMKFKESMHVHEMKRGNAFNIWRTVPKSLGQDEGNCPLIF